MDFIRACFAEVLGRFVGHGWEMFGEVWGDVLGKCWENVGKPLENVMCLFWPVGKSVGKSRAPSNTCKQAPENYHLRRIQFLMVPKTKTQGSRRRRM